MKRTALLTFMAFAFVTAAYATAPTHTVDSVDSVIPSNAAELQAPANLGGIYDNDALMCIDAAPDTEAGANETRCWKCGDGSKDACSGGDKHCYGERSDCLKKGCKITGSTSTCSSSKKTC